MGKTEDLEDRLRASWDEATLAVYADHLQAIGDPRGELIALDLRPDGGHEARRGELLRTWFSPLEVWWDGADACWYGGSRGNTWISFDRGLVEVVVVGPDISALLRFIKHPACEFLRRLSITTSAVSMRAAIGGLVRREHHWLGALALQRADYIDAEIVRHDASELVAATPCLEHLEVSGRRVLCEIQHPTVRTLVVTGHDAIELATGAPMTAVTTLDFAFEHGSAAAENGVGSVISGRRFPSLRRLRLWRERSEVAFASLARLDVLPQLGHLGLPPLCFVQDVRRAQAALDRMPQLSELSFSRAHAIHGDLGADLRHATARIRRPEPVPWPPSGTGIALRAIVIDDVRIEAGILVDAMEAQFDDLPEGVQHVWLRFWNRLVALDHGGQSLFPAALLRAALEAVSGGGPAIDQLIEQLRAARNVQMHWLE